MLLDKIKQELKVHLNWKLLKNAYRQDKSEQQEFIQLCVSRSSSGPTDCAPISAAGNAISKKIHVGVVTFKQNDMHFFLSAFKIKMEGMSVKLIRLQDWMERDGGNT